MSETTKQPKLTENQRELLEAMNLGVIVHYMPYMGRFCPHAYYFRSDTMDRCTSVAKSLLKKGIVEKCDANIRDHKLRVKKGQQ